MAAVHPRQTDPAARRITRTIAGATACHTEIAFSAVPRLCAATSWPGPRGSRFGARRRRSWGQGPSSHSARRPIGGARAATRTRGRLPGRAQRQGCLVRAGCGGLPRSGQRKQQQILRLPKDCGQQIVAFSATRADPPLPGRRRTTRTQPALWPLCVGSVFFHVAMHAHTVRPVLLVKVAPRCRAMFPTLLPVPFATRWSCAACYEGLIPGPRAMPPAHGSAWGHGELKLQRCTVQCRSLVKQRHSHECARLH